MRILHRVTEDAVIATYLQGELDSQRFGPDLSRHLAKTGKPREILTHPNLADQRENRLRRDLLNATRQYENRTGLFDRFPHDVTWHLAILSQEEILKARYINYSYWVELSDGSRLPADAAQRIREGKEVFGVSNEQFHKAAEAIKRQESFPPLILVAPNPDSPLVVLEGHLRLTAYALAEGSMPAELEAYLGVSPDMAKWALY
jgi:hypothetical protein